MHLPLSVGLKVYAARERPKLRVMHGYGSAQCRRLFHLSQCIVQAEYCDSKWPGGSRVSTVLHVLLRKKRRNVEPAEVSRAWLFCSDTDFDHLQ